MPSVPEVGGQGAPEEEGRAFLKREDMVPLRRKAKRS